MVTHGNTLKDRMKLDAYEAGEDLSAGAIVPVRAEFVASDAVRQALANLGRTEDIRFSPDNRLLAVAGFLRRKLLLLSIGIVDTNAGPVVQANDWSEIVSDGIGEVHGVEFIDNRVLAIANRNAKVALIELPERLPSGGPHRVPVIRRVHGALRRIKSPGSVTFTRTAGGQVALLVCNNYAHRVTRHVLAPRLGYLNWRNHTLLSQGLDIPDGIAVSSDGRWFAVSSHGTRDVKIYDTAAPLGPRTQPAGVLRDANYPHGLRFTADDRHIVVADAASPHVLVYRRGDDWSGAKDPVRAAAVLDRATFARGHVNPEEGGPKGIDIDRTGRVVAITCEEDPLAFFTLASVLGNS